MLLKALEEQDAPAGAVCSWRTEEQCTHVLLIFINIPSVKDPDTCYHTLRSTDDSSIAAAWECSTPVRSAAPAARELASGHQAQLNFAALGVSLFYCCFSRCPEELPSGAQAQVSACLGEVVHSPSKSLWESSSSFFCYLCRILGFLFLLALSFFCYLCGIPGFFSLLAQVIVDLLLQVWARILLTVWRKLCC